MSVLDPFEVYEIQVWPLVDLEGVTKSSDAGQYELACETLDALEYSAFKAVLNEKDPPTPNIDVELPESFRGRVVSDEVHEIRKHPDVRIARRALTLSRLAQVISERQVSAGLRRVLSVQAKRLQWLAERRFERRFESVSGAVED